MIMNELRRRAIEASPLCVGIDLREDHIPEELQSLPLERQFVEYAKEIVEASAGYASCYKVQIACYEAYGLQGLQAYKEILSLVRRAGHIVIADIKRGDIGSTAQMYAQGHFEGDFEADILTLNPYMGHDAISPYTEYIRKKNKGAFILGKTSNAGSADFQDLRIGDECLYERVLKTIGRWNEAMEGFEGYGGYGAVVGVNHAGELERLKAAIDGLFLLIPGYGAQGAKIEDIAALVQKNKNGVINVSRGYTANIGKDFRRELRMRAVDLAEELGQCFR